MSDWIKCDDIKDDLNSYIKSKGYGNYYDHLRRNGVLFEWGINTYKGMYWFPMTQACIGAEEYIHKLTQLGV